MFELKKYIKYHPEPGIVLNIVYEILNKAARAPALMELTVELQA